MASIKDLVFDPVVEERVRLEGELVPREIVRAKLELDGVTYHYQGESAEEVEKAAAVDVENHS